MAAGVYAPCPAHLDAPFYGDISRRRLDVKLPLNAVLLDALAEACAAGALAISDDASGLPRNAAFDLAAWTPPAEQSTRLRAAFRKSGV